MIVSEQERTKSLCISSFFAEEMQTLRPCSRNGCNSGLSHPLVTACFLLSLPFYYRLLIIRGGVEDTRLEAKDTKKIRGQGQGQPFRGQTLSRPRTGMLEAKDQGHSRKCSPKKKVFKKVFQAISNLKASPEFLIGEA